MRPRGTRSSSLSSRTHPGSPTASSASFSTGTRAFDRSLTTSGEPVVSGAIVGAARIYDELAHFGHRHHSVAVATILQGAWSQLGINLKIVDVDLNTMLSRVYSTTNPDYDIVFFYPDYASTTR